MNEVRSERSINAGSFYLIWITLVPAAKPVRPFERACDCRPVARRRFGTVDDFVGDFFAAMGGQAVHEQGVFWGLRHQRRVDLIVCEVFQALLRFGLLAHAGPHVGVDGGGFAHRLGGIDDCFQLKLGDVVFEMRSE